MDLYILNSSFNPVEVLDSHVSFVWRDRFREPGELHLVVPDSFQSSLPPGTLLGPSRNNEIMVVKTCEIEDGVMTVTGDSLLDIFRDRVIRMDVPAGVDSWTPYGYPPAAMMANIVAHICTDTPVFADTLDINIVPEAQIFTDLSTSVQEDVGAADISVTLPFGTLYDSLKIVADQYDVGMHLRAPKLPPSPYTRKLLFTAYTGEDRTSDQSVLPVVRFSEKLDSLINPKYLISNKDYKNASYSFYDSADVPYSGVAYVDAAAEASTGLDRHVIQTVVSPPEFDTTGLTGLEIAAIQQQYIQLVAEKALIEHKPKKLLSAELAVNSDFVLDTDYFLGDIVELQLADSSIQKVRVTEVATTQDVTGTKINPVVTVIE